jgi:hypothetical protein
MAERPKHIIDNYVQFVHTKVVQKGINAIRARIQIITEEYFGLGNYDVNEIQFSTFRLPCKTAFS